MENASVVTTKSYDKIAFSKDRLSKMIVDPQPPMCFCWGCAGDRLFSTLSESDCVKRSMSDREIHPR